VLFAEGINPQMGFDAAIEAVGAAIPVPTERWDSLRGSDQAWAFTVAGVMQADVLADIQAAVQKFIDEGGDYKDFKKTFDDAIARTGLGALAPWRARLVLNQNISNAYQAGRYARQEDPEYQRIAPYREYAHGFSDKPRAAHLALDGFVARTADPIWATIFPPNGYNCSCRVFTLTQGQFDRGNYTLSDPLPSVEGDNFGVRLPNGEVLPIASPGFEQAPIATRTRTDAIALAKQRLPQDMWEALGIQEDTAGIFAEDELSGLFGDDTESDGLDDLLDIGEDDPLIADGADDGLGDLFGTADSGAEDDLAGLFNSTADEIASANEAEAELFGTFSQEVPAPYEKSYKELTALARERHAKRYEELAGIKSAVTPELETALEKAKADIKAKPTSRPARQRLQKAEKNLLAAQKKDELARLAVFERWYADVISKDDGLARQWAESVDIDISASSVYGEERIRGILEDFYKISGGKPTNLVTIDYKDRYYRGELTDEKERAYALRDEQRVNVGQHVYEDGVVDEVSLRKILFHEMGHHVEFGDDLRTRPKYSFAAEGWRDDRATSDEPQKLSEITGFSGYGDDEVAKPGDFFHPYLGKVYRDGSTEVVAMGIENFTDPAAMLRLYERQPDLFDFVLGVTEDGLPDRLPTLPDREPEPEQEEPAPYKPKKVRDLLPDDIDFDDDDEEEYGRFYTYEAEDPDGNSHELSFTVDKGNNVAFEVDNQWNRDNDSLLDRRTAMSLLLKVRQIMEIDAQSRPDGFIYATEAASADGLGNKRASLYARAGFSPPGEDGMQYAIVRGGKLFPTDTPPDIAEEEED
jgi:hypothetical protein